MAGMLRTPRRTATFGASSAFSLNNLICGSNTTAACSNAGAMARHGPHQGAQTSSNAGMLLARTCRSKPTSSTAAGCASNSALWQPPQRAALAGRSGGTWFTVPQCGQTI